MLADAPIDLSSQTEKLAEWVFAGGSAALAVLTAFLGIYIIQRVFKSTAGIEDYSDEIEETPADFENSFDVDWNSDFGTGWYPEEHWDGEKWVPDPDFVLTPDKAYEKYQYEADVEDMIEEERKSSNQ